MKVIIEEIIEVHPAGAKAGSYHRHTRGWHELPDAFLAYFSDAKSKIPDIWREVANQRKVWNVLHVRVYAAGDDIALLIDVAELEISKKIIASIEDDDDTKATTYEEWAAENGVWP